MNLAGYSMQDSGFSLCSSFCIYIAGSFAI